MQQVGYPAGAFSLVTGLGRVAGQAMADHMDIDKVSQVLRLQASPDRSS